MYKIGSLILAGLAIAGCETTPTQTGGLKITSFNQQGLSLGLVGSNISATITNEDNVDSDSDRRPEPLATVFYVPNDENNDVVPLGDVIENGTYPYGTCQTIISNTIDFPASVSSKAHGAGIIQNMPVEAFPNTVSAMQRLREANPTLDIELLVSFDEVSLSGAPPIIGESSVQYEFDGSADSFMTISMVGFGESYGTSVPLLQWPMPELSILYDFNSPDDCAGELVTVSSKSTVTGGSSPAPASGVDAKAEHLAIALALGRDTLNKPIGLKIFIPDFVGRVDAPVKYLLGVSPYTGFAESSFACLLVGEGADESSCGG